MTFFNIPSTGEIPFVDFIRRAAKDPMDDLADKISTTYSAVVGSFLFAMLGTTMLFTDNAYSCQVPPHYDGNWVNYAKYYCLVNPFDYLITEADDDTPLTKLISYLPWLVMIVFLQIELFYIPWFLWGCICRHSDLDLTSVVHNARDVHKKVGEEVGKALDRISNYVIRQKKLSMVHPALFCLNSPVVCFYIFKKWLAFFIAFLQLYFIVQIVGDGDYGWGFNALEYSLSGLGKFRYSPEEYLHRVPTSSIFPTFAYCTVPFFVDGRQEFDTFSCVLTMNYLAEKIYMVMYFWLIFSSMVALISASYTTIFYMCPSFHLTTVKEGLKNSKGPYVSEKRLHEFVYNFLHADGILALKLVENACGKAVFEQLLEKLWIAHRYRNNPKKSIAANEEVAVEMNENAAPRERILQCC